MTPPPTLDVAFDDDQPPKRPLKSAPDLSESFEVATPVPVGREPDPPPAPIVVRPPAPTTGRTLPHSLEAEEHVLSCCLMEEESDAIIARCQEARLRADDFYDPRHGIIYAVLLEMHGKRLPVSVATLAEELKSSRRLEQVGGYPAIVQISDRAPTTAQASYFIRKLKDQSMLREIIRTASTTIEDCYACTGDLPALTADLKRRMTFATDGSSPKTPYTVWQPATFREYEPPPNLNILGAGYVRRRQLTTLIGPPGVGKTRLSHWLAISHITSRRFIDIDCANGPAKWMFFGNENDPLRQKTDLEFFYKHLTHEEQALVDSHLYLHVMDQPDDGIITLADPEAYAKLLSTLKLVIPDVVVFDPWGNMIEGNENDNEEVRRTLKLLLRAISATCPTAAIIVIHHARTGRSTAIEAGNNFSGGSLGRGSKALVSSARCELALWPGHSEDSSRLVLTCEKVNNVKKFEPKGLLFENGIYVSDSAFDIEAWKDDIEGVRSTGKTLTIEDLVEAVKSGVCKKKDLVDYCENNFSVGRATVTRRLKEAVDKDWLHATVPIGSYVLGLKATPSDRSKHLPYKDDD